jgi:hypothetical protein
MSLSIHHSEWVRSFEQGFLTLLYFWLVASCHYAVVKEPGSTSVAKKTPNFFGGAIIG